MARSLIIWPCIFRARETLGMIDYHFTKTAKLYIETVAEGEYG